MIIWNTETNNSISFGAKRETQKKEKLSNELDNY